MRVTIILLALVLLAAPALAIDNIGGYYREYGYGYGPWGGAYAYGGYGGYGAYGYDGWNNGGCLNCPAWNVRTPVMSTWGCPQPWASSVRPWTQNPYSSITVGRYR